MPKITRKTAVIFGGGLSAGSHQVEQFGSKVQGGSPVYTVDPDQIQALSAWLDGWIPAIDSGTKAPYVQDMNGFCLVVAYQIAYILQQGIPEWVSTTTYFIDSVVQANSGDWYQSLVDNNTNNPPPAGASNSFWLWLNPPALLPSGSLPAGSIPKISGAASVGAVGSLNMVAGLLSDDGTNVVITGTPNTNGIKFPDNSVQYVAAISSAPTSRQVFTGGGARSLNTPYTAASGPGAKPIFVTASVNVGGVQDISLKANGVEISNAASTDSVTGIHGCVSGWIFPGESYRVDSGGNLLVWTEVQ